LSEGNEPGAQDGAGTSLPEVARDPSRGGAVFISYASQDAQTALRICNALRAAGIEVWFDQSELRGGDAWDRKIRSQIRDSSLFIPIISTHSEAMAAGVIFRKKPAAHKRLMLLSAVAISDAGSARIWLIGFKTNLPGLFGWWIQYFWGISLILVAMILWDLLCRRRVHPTVLFGAALLWTGEIIVTLLDFSPSWRGAMVRLVNAWGYTG
jgi:TIR domain